MVTTRIPARATAVVMAFATLGLTGLLAAAPALAANSVTVEAAKPSAVGIDYTCESAAGVASIDAMVGDPNADRPAATGSQTTVTCDGSPHTATIALTPMAGETPLTSGTPVQVRVALVDQSETVVSGTAKLLTLD
ncbi:hypothetical protein VMT65_08820 [Nocardia sp. CDC153]|uniref:hypothetical protein n=1 Tax=Nocardia sp. CDC153 TaxID=3112167 RepID=UPI002DBE4CC0|nr:hypothetical protein [Nocardia sp. CDC153]MEC3953126.1 hypothetical protein [Nocardia sp. CDC153]